MISRSHRAEASSTHCRHCGAHPSLWGSPCYGGPDERVLAKDINGEGCPHTQEELDQMIEALESTGRYDVVGRRW